jgi:capsule polysaccharide export protein KpsC/LpsZ
MKKNYGKEFKLFKNQLYMFSKHKFLTLVEGCNEVTVTKEDVNEISYFEVIQRKVDGFPSDSLFSGFTRESMLIFFSFTFFLYFFLKKNRLEF